MHVTVSVLKSKIHDNYLTQAFYISEKPVLS